MEYELVYKSNLYAMNIIFLLIMIVLLSVSLYFVFSMKEKRERIISFFFIFLIFSFIYGEINRKIVSNSIQSSINSNAFFTLEGKVKDLHTMLNSGNGKNSFKIDDEYFDISYTGNYSEKKTFYYTVTKNGKSLIKYDGQKVRVDYIKIDGENKIIKMWTK